MSMLLFIYTKLSYDSYRSDKYDVEDRLEWKRMTGQKESGDF
jgi:hypothetical protein